MYFRPPNLIHFIRSTKIKGIIGLHPDSYKLSPEENPTPRLSKESACNQKLGFYSLFLKKNGTYPYLNA